MLFLLSREAWHAPEYLFNVASVGIPQDVTRCRADTLRIDVKHNARVVLLGYLEVYQVRGRHGIQQTLIAHDLNGDKLQRIVGGIAAGLANQADRSVAYFRDISERHPAPCFPFFAPWACLLACGDFFARQQRQVVFVAEFAQYLDAPRRRTDTEFQCLLLDEVRRHKRRLPRAECVAGIRARVINEHITTDKTRTADLAQLMEGVKEVACKARRLANHQQPVDRITAEYLLTLEFVWLATLPLQNHHGFLGEYLSAPLAIEREQPGLLGRAADALKTLVGKEIDKSGTGSDDALAKVLDAGEHRPMGGNEYQRGLNAITATDRLAAASGTKSMAGQILPDGSRIL